MERKSIIKTLFAVACIVLFASACCSKKPAAKANETTTQPADKGVAGILVNMGGLDGCKWMIELEDGSKLQPTNLAAFDIALEERKEVTVEYTEQTGVMSTCMAGKVVKIITMKER